MVSAVLVWVQYSDEESNDIIYYKNKKTKKVRKITYVNEVDIEDAIGYMPDSFVLGDMMDEEDKHKKSQEEKGNSTDDPVTWRICTHFYSLIKERKQDCFVDIAFKATDGSKVYDILSDKENDYRDMNCYCSEKSGVSYYLFPKSEKDEESYYNTTGTRSLLIKKGKKETKAHLETIAAFHSKKYEAMLNDLTRIYDQCIFSKNSRQSVGKEKKCIDKRIERSESFLAEMERLLHKVELLAETDVIISYRRVSEEKIKRMSPRVQQALENHDGAKITAEMPDTTFDIYEHRMIKRFLVAFEEFCKRQERNYSNLLGETENDIPNETREAIKFGTKIDNIVRNIKYPAHNMFIEELLEIKSNSKRGNAAVVDCLAEYARLAEGNHNVYTDYETWMKDHGFEYDDQKMKTKYETYLLHKDDEKKKRGWANLRKKSHSLVKSLSITGKEVSGKSIEKLHSSNLFRDHPLYRKVYKLMNEYKEIESGIALFSDTNRNNIASIQRIFEYWCFIKVLDIFIYTYQFKVIGEINLKDCLQDYFKSGGHERAEEQIVKLQRKIIRDGKRYIIDLQICYQKEIKSRVNEKTYRPDLYIKVGYQYNDEEGRKHREAYGFVFDAKYRDYGKKGKAIQTIKQWKKDLYDVAYIKYYVMLKDNLDGLPINGAYIIHPDTETDRYILPDEEWSRHCLANSDLGFANRSDMKIQLSNYYGMWFYDYFFHDLENREPKTDEYLNILFRTKTGNICEAAKKSGIIKEEGIESFDDARIKQLFSNNVEMKEQYKGKFYTPALGNVGAISMQPGRDEYIKMLICRIMEWDIKVKTYKKDNDKFSGYDLICWNCGKSEGIRSHAGSYCKIYSCSCGKTWERTYPVGFRSDGNKYFNRRSPNYIPKYRGSSWNTVDPIDGRGKY